MAQGRKMNLQQLINNQAIFFVSHSGGKDSQAMYNHLNAMIPHDQIVVIHAHLGVVEWPGVIDHIKENISHELHVVNANWADSSDKDFLNMVERRFEKRPDVPCWPSPSQRQCTSDLKRDPIHKFIRRITKERGATIAVNCTGMRAEESAARSKLTEWSDSKRLTNLSRTVYEWLPIHDWTIGQVFQNIADAGQKPHFAYIGDNEPTAKAPLGGNERLSCMFCIMGFKGDLRHAAKHNPELAARYIALEEKTGYTMFHKTSLKNIIATDAGQA